MRPNVYSSTAFTGGCPLCTQIYLDRVVPINHSWRQKTRDTRLADGGDRIPLRSFVRMQYRSVTDRRTDGQTDGFAVAYTALCKASFAECCKNIAKLEVI